VLVLLLRRWAPALALLGVGVGLVAAMVTLVRVAGGARYVATLPGLPDLPLRLTVTPLTAVLAAFVAVVSSLVMLYAVGYMEEGKVRFFVQMSFFAAAMQTLVIATYYLLASGIGIELSLITLFAFVSMVQVAASLPISLGGLGIREGVLVALLAGIGVDIQLGVALSLLFLLTLWLCSLPGAVVMLLKRT